MEQRFVEAVNSLELAKAKMHGAVPNAVHAALKERYTRLLAQMGRLTGQYQRMCRAMDVPPAVKQLPPDDWRHYGDRGEAGGEDDDDDGRGAAGDGVLGAWTRLRRACPGTLSSRFGPTGTGSRPATATTASKGPAEPAAAVCDAPQNTDVGTWGVARL